MLYICNFYLKKQGKKIKIIKPFKNINTFNIIKRKIGNNNNKNNKKECEFQIFIILYYYIEMFHLIIIIFFYIHKNKNIFKI